MTDMLQSFDPASRELIWEGPVARSADCARAISTARAALPGWRALPVDDRIAIIRSYAAILGDRRAELAQLISRETGKLLWESDAEVGSMIAKVEEICVKFGFDTDADFEPVDASTWATVDV